MKEFGENFGNSSDFHKENIDFMSRYACKENNLLAIENIHAKKEYFDPDKVREDLVKKAQELAKKDCIRTLQRDISQLMDE